MNEQTLYTDEWITVTVDSNRFVLTWLNAVAGIAVVRVVFVRRPHNRARIGRALVGPDGGVWLESPALDIADPHATPKRWALALRSWSNTSKGRSSHEPRRRRPCSATSPTASSRSQAVAALRHRSPSRCATRVALPRLPARVLAR